MTFAGFDWDHGNREKCEKHGVTPAEIEHLFLGGIDIRPDLSHSGREERFNAHGTTLTGRSVFVVFTIRERSGKAYIRPISARYMHRKEIARYEKDNPEIQE